MGKRQNVDAALITQNQNVILSGSAKRQRRDPSLVSFQVLWGPKDVNKPEEPKFHIVTRVKTSDVCNNLEIVQYVMDGIRVKSGPPDPKSLSYRRDTWMKDDREVSMNSGTSGEYDDTPGYDPSYGITAQTDLKYIFGAYWEVYINGTRAVKTTPLFGLIKGKHPRIYKPGSEVAATWDLQHSRWDNQGDLMDHFPRWWPYRRPKVDNENTTYRGRIR